MALGARLLPLMQQTQGVKAAIKQGQRVIGGGFDELFGQFHFVAAIAVKRTANQHMTGQFHLADHAHLGKTGIAMLITGRVIALSIFQRIGRAPNDAVDTQQAQLCPGRVISGFMPTLLSQIEDLSHGLATQSLAGLNHGAGRHQRALPRQHDVHTADHIPG
ncbi:hypothetical protein D9M68_799940 [compost metagenome]